MGAHCSICRVYVDTLSNDRVDDDGEWIEPVCSSCHMEQVAAGLDDDGIEVSSGEFCSKCGVMTDVTCWGMCRACAGDSWPK